MGRAKKGWNKFITAALLFVSCVGKALKESVVTKVAATEVEAAFNLCIAYELAVELSEPLTLSLILVTTSAVQPMGNKIK